MIGDQLRDIRHLFAHGVVLIYADEGRGKTVIGLNACAQLMSLRTRCLFISAEATEPEALDTLHQMGCRAPHLAYWRFVDADDQFEQEHVL